MIVQNMDIAGLVRRIRRVREELQKCVSAGLMHVTDHDKARIASYLESLSVYFDWMIAQPQQDFVEWHPTDIDLGDAELEALPENEALADMIQQFAALEQEMAYSASARMHTSMMEHDERRFREIVEKIGNFLDNYIEQIQPLDMPESSPRRELAGKGRRTVKGS
jgi:hypothetical protein